MSVVVVGFIETPEGEAALRRGIEEARRRNGRLVVVHSMRGGTHEPPDVQYAYRQSMEAVTERLHDEGLQYDAFELVRGNDPVADVLDIAEQRGAELIVIGHRRRSRVGKLMLGSNAQDILLASDIPVLVVKADEDS